MPLQLPHKDVDLYHLSKKILHCCYELTQDLPEAVQKTLAHQMRQASLFAYQNITLGLVQDNLKKQRNRFRSAIDYLVVIDSVLDVLLEFSLVAPKDSQQLTDYIKSAYMIVEGRRDIKKEEWKKQKKY